MLLCRSPFSDQAKTHACLCVREALSMSVRGEGASDNCIYMFVCVCVRRKARTVRGAWRAARWRL